MRGRGLTASVHESSLFTFAMAYRMLMPRLLGGEHRGLAVLHCMLGATHSSGRVGDARYCILDLIDDLRPKRMERY